MTSCEGSVVPSINSNNIQTLLHFITKHSTPFLLPSLSPKRRGNDSPPPFFLFPYIFLSLHVFLALGGPFLLLPPSSPPPNLLYHLLLLLSLLAVVVAGESVSPPPFPFFFFFNFHYLLSLSPLAPGAGYNRAYTLFQPFFFISQPPPNSLWRTYFGACVSHTPQTTNKNTPLITQILHTI